MILNSDYYSPCTLCNYDLQYLIAEQLNNHRYNSTGNCEATIFQVFGSSAATQKVQPPKKCSHPKDIVNCVYYDVTFLNSEHHCKPNAFKLSTITFEELFYNSSIIEHSTLSVNCDYNLQVHVIFNKTTKLDSHEGAGTLFAEMVTTILVWNCRYNDTYLNLFMIGTASFFYTARMLR